MLLTRVLLTRGVFTVLGITVLYVVCYSFLSTTVVHITMLVVQQAASIEWGL